MNEWFWLVVAIAGALLVILIAIGLWFFKFFTHMMDGF